MTAEQRIEPVTCVFYFAVGNLPDNVTALGIVFPSPLAHVHYVCRISLPFLFFSLLFSSFLFFSLSSLFLSFFSSLFFLSFGGFLFIPQLWKKSQGGLLNRGCGSNSCPSIVAPGSLILELSWATIAFGDEQ